MNPIRQAVIAALGGALISGLALAQTPAPAPGSVSSNPDSASSPAQRSTTSTEATEAPAAGGGAEPADASTPHQGSMMKHNSMMMKGSAPGAAPSASTFVQKAGQDGMTEVQVAKLALQKSKDANVREFASRMEKDHSKANSELMSIAAKKSIAAPKALDAEHQAMVQEMSSKSGAAFDASYAQHMAVAHGKAVALFTSATKSSDRDIAAFASKTLPTLEEHKQMADGLSAKTKTAEASGAASAR